MGWLKRRIIEELEPTMAEWERRWIPVTERMPTPGEDVLAFTHNYGPVVASTDTAGTWRATHKDYESGEPYLRDAGTVSHWMPLPAPPTDGK
jgi:hypothetical protein